MITKKFKLEVVNENQLSKIIMEAIADNGESVTIEFSTIKALFDDLKFRIRQAMDYIKTEDM